MVLVNESLGHGRESGKQPHFEGFQKIPRKTLRVHSMLHDEYERKISKMASNEAEEQGCFGTTILFSKLKKSQGA